MRTHCLIPACPRAPGLSLQPDRHKWLCEEHWKILPMPLKRRWWDETSTSKLPPSEALQQVVIEAVQAREETT